MSWFPSGEGLEKLVSLQAQAARERRRDEFAMSALQGKNWVELDGISHSPEPPEIADLCYRIADAMMARRDK